MTSVFIDGSEGTTGLRIFDRFAGRSDIELIKIDPEKRKDVNERKKLINESDVTFLCLPDAAAIESVGLVQNPAVKIIDTSTAHRCAEGWSYGFPELSPEHRSAIANGKRTAVPGCHAGGFVSIVYPLIKLGIISADYPLSCFSVTGYSGGGKKMIAEYESEERSKELLSPRQYGLQQKHKHLREMKAVCGLDFNPIFCPVVADYYSGMVVSVSIYAHLMQKKLSAKELQSVYAQHYCRQAFVKVQERDEVSFLASNALSGYDGMEIEVHGNDERIVVTSRFDNLGKGASGAAVQCMNIMLGIDEKTGLNI